MELSADDICKLAAKGEELPDGLDAEERALWGAMNHMYQLYRKGTLGIDKGKQMRIKAIRTYEQDKAIRECRIGAYSEFQTLYKALEQYSSEYFKRPSLEIADKIVHAIYHIWPDTVREEQKKNG